MTEPVYQPYDSYIEYPPGEMLHRSQEFAGVMKRRRTVRDFSDRVVPLEIIKNCLLAAGASPSGANLQPWTFVVVSDPEIKTRIRIAAEEEEREFYTRRATPEWLAALAPLGTDTNKPFLETAPYLIAIFVQSYGLLPGGRRMKHYYAHESVGIATGILIAALQNAGLAALTHTPSPMDFLGKILGRPANERPYLLLVAGYPAPSARVPVIPRKTLDQIAVFLPAKENPEHA